MCRFKVEILIDEEKVIKDDKYEPKDMYDCIRKMFKRFDLPEIKTDKPNHFIFTDKGRKRDYGALWRAILDLYDNDWFKRYKAVTIPHTEIQGVKLEADKATDKNGIAVFEKYEANGDKYDYYLMEVAAPSGYNLLVEAVKVNFADNEVDGDGYYTVNIPNISMIEMPVTGGFSTVIFYVIGIALMLSALAAYIIFLKKVKAKENR